MKFELIDKAYNIVGFDRQANELTYVLNKKVIVAEQGNPLNSAEEQEKLIYNGFKLALDIIEQCPEMIKPSLVETMKVIKRKYQSLTKFSRDYSEIGAISCALNHVQRVVMINNITVRDTAFALEQKKQYKEDERKAKQLAKDIKEMLTGNTRKPIWALKVKGKDSIGAEPFIAGYNQTEVAKRINGTNLNVGKVLNGKAKTVKGYTFWIE